MSLDKFWWAHLLVEFRVSVPLGSQGYVIIKVATPQFESPHSRIRYYVETYGCLILVAFGRITFRTNRNMDNLPNLQRPRIHTKIHRHDRIGRDIQPRPNQEERIARFDPILWRHAAFIPQHTRPRARKRPTAGIVRRAQLGRHHELLSVEHKVRACEVVGLGDITDPAVEHGGDLFEGVAGLDGVVGCGTVAAGAWGAGLTGGNDGAWTVEGRSRRRRCRRRCRSCCGKVHDVP